MKVIKGNIWDFHDEGFPIIVTTNGDINASGKCVMGRGIAEQAKKRWPCLPKTIADHIKKHGNVVGWFGDYNLFSFPTKHHWYLKSDLDLIEQSCRQLRGMWDLSSDPSLIICMVKPGVGNGKRRWEEVEPILDRHLDDRFIIVDY